MRVAVFGASGFIGRHLTVALAGAGHEVVVVGRRLDALPVGKRIERAVADAADPAAVLKILQGVEVAYYLVHSMAGPDFERVDAHLARTFAHAARTAGTRRIVYLGGLGDRAASRHLRSRAEVGSLLASTGVEVVTLRAAVILGAGSISFEMLRYLVERLPFMVCPRWVSTRIEPIAQRDVIAYLLKAVDVPAGEYEIGCGEISSYRRLMDVYARARGLPRRLVVHVPLLSLRLSAYWVDFVTPVDRQVSHALIESLSSEVVVRDRARTDDAFGITPTKLDAAMQDALDSQRDDVSATLLAAERGLRNGVYFVREERTLPDEAVEAGPEQLSAIGGELGWYGIARSWKARLVLGNMLGESNTVQRPAELAQGVDLDWWRIERLDRNAIVLRSLRWVFGEGWLGYDIGNGRIAQAAAFRPRGVLGFAYWTVLRPIHSLAFRAMADHQRARLIARARVRDS